MSQQIDGLPVGVKITQVTIPVTALHFPGVVAIQATIQVESDNVYGALDLTGVPIPEGFERDGDNPEEWFREPDVTKEYWIGARYDCCFYPSVASGPDPRRIIIRKLKPKTRRVLVVELPILEIENSTVGWMWAPVGQHTYSTSRLTIPGSTAVTSCFANSLAATDNEFSSPRFRIEERPA